MNPNEKRIMEDLGVCIVAMLILFAGSFSSDPIISLFFFVLSGGIAIICSVDLFLAFKNKSFPSFRRNKKGIVWVWAVAAITIGFTALAWFAVSYPLFMIIDVIEGSYNYPSEAEPIINLVRAVLGWFLAVEVFGVLIWALVSSFRKEEQQYPVPGG